MNYKTKFLKVRAARVEKQYSQQDIADNLGIARETYSKKELGKSPFKLEEMEKLCEILGKSHKQLFS